MAPPVVAVASSAGSLPGVAIAGEFSAKGRARPAMLGCYCMSTAGAGP
jgi:hypothetical protein